MSTDDERGTLAEELSRACMHDLRELSGTQWSAGRAAIVQSVLMSVIRCRPSDDPARVVAIVEKHVVTTSGRISVCFQKIAAELDPERVAREVGAALVREVTGRS